MKLKNLLVLIISFMLFGSLSRCQNIEQDVKKTQEYYKRYGIKKSKIELQKIYRAAEITASILYNFESGDLETRTRKLFCISGQESDMKLGNIICNIPGVYLPPFKKTIKTFSLDFGHSGVNQQNIRWTYAISDALKQHNEVLRHKKLLVVCKKYGLSEEFYNCIKDYKIPQEIKLKKINPDFYYSMAKKIYLHLLESGLSPNQIRKNINITFKEDTQDDVTSLMIYRILVETNMKCILMNKKIYNTDIYKFISNK